MIKGVVFDMDGTITVPVIDFAKLREELNVDSKWDLLKDLNLLTDSEKKKHLSVIHKYEKEAIDNIKLQEGVVKSISMLKSRGIKLAVLTRNSMENTEHVLDIMGIDFDTVITREFPHVKPEPEPIYYLSKEWNLKKEHLMIIGDNKDDILCGKNAGIKTCLYSQDSSGTSRINAMADYIVSNYEEFNLLIKSLI
ncbi:MAG: HAD family hydrolase [bacterium]|nr:HAD family hydrolase [bacterium]